MYLLDTDHISLMGRGGAEAQAIRTRLKRVPPDDVSASTISYEEQIRGWMSVTSVFISSVCTQEPPAISLN